MIDKNLMAEAARYADAQVAELGTIEAWAEQNRISVRGLTYVAEQRAMRAGYALDGKDPRTLSQTHFLRLSLSPETQHLMPLLAAVWMDGLACGVTAARREDEDA